MNKKLLYPKVMENAVNKSQRRLEREYEEVRTLGRLEVFPLSSSLEAP